MKSIMSFTLCGLLLSVTAACSGPEQVASKYITAINGKRFHDADALLDSRSSEYLGAEGVSPLYSNLSKPLTVGRVTTTGNRAIVPLTSAGQADSGDNDNNRRLVLKKTDNGWKVVDCALLAYVALLHLSTSDFDKAMSGVGIVKDNNCNETAATNMEAAILREKGANAYSAGAYEKATEALQRSLLLAPSATAHYTLGYVYRDNKSVTNNKQRAVEEFKMAVQMEPNSEYHAALADAYRQNGNIDGALGEFQKALALDPMEKQAHFFYAMALWQKNRHSDAIEQLELVMALDPDYRNTREMLATIKRDRAIRASYLRWR